MNSTVGLIKCRFCKCSIKPNKDFNHYMKAHRKEYREEQEILRRQRQQGELNAQPVAYVSEEMSQTAVLVEEPTNITSIADLDDYNEWNPTSTINVEEEEGAIVQYDQYIQRSQNFANTCEVKNNFNNPKSNAYFGDTNSENDWGEVEDESNLLPRRDANGGVMQNEIHINQDDPDWDIEDHQHNVVNDVMGDEDWNEDEEQYNEVSPVEQEKRQWECYIPSPPPTEECEIFNTGIQTGINFSKVSCSQVDVIGDHAPQPIGCFEELELPPELVVNIKKAGFSKPTQIQKVCMPIISAGRDLMGCGHTGTGKTAAFVIPIIQELMINPREMVIRDSQVIGKCVEPQAIIMCPTRELVLQIFHETRKFSYNTKLVSQVAYGGVFVDHQLKQLQSGCHILIATPGRLRDFCIRDAVAFSSLRFVVLDEADRMLDMGFLPDMESFLGHSTMAPSEQRQTLMFSATFPQEIQDLADDFLSNRIFATVGIVGSACTDIVQRVVSVKKFDKRDKLIEILSETGREKTMIFVERRVTADFISGFLCQNDFKATSIHGDRLQSAREQALRDFRSGVTDILVATSVAARGLDIRGVNHVINFDLPESIDVYVHRIGRTGRIGNPGRATTFYDHAYDVKMADKLATILRGASQEIPDFLSNDQAFHSDEFNANDVDAREFNGEELNGGDFNGEDEEQW